MICRNCGVMTVLGLFLITHDDLVSMTSAERNRFERFINSAISHRDWLNYEASRIAGSADCETSSAPSAISGAIWELDEMIRRTNLESEKTSFQSG
jgi:hypothetical protein